jgi:hypothetical protein
MFSYLVIYSPEITRYIRQLFSIHECKNISVSEIMKGLYAWKLTRNSDAPELLSFTVKLGSATFGTMFEDGRENEMGE